MLEEIKFTPDDPHPGRDILFDRIKHFRLLDRRNASVKVRSSRIGSVTMAVVQSTGHDVSVDERDRSAVLIPLSGRIEIEQEKTVKEAGAGKGLLLDPGFRTTHVRPEHRWPFGAIVLLLPAAPRRQERSGRILDFVADPSAASLHGFVRYLADELPKQSGVLTQTIASRSAEALLLDLVAELQRLTEREDIAAARHVRKAEEIMNERFDTSLTVEALANEVGVGPRSLQAAFRSLRGASPREILTAIRLEQARERLCAPRSADTVTDIALTCGFAHLGRFATAYRARFGESPSQTLRGVLR